MAVDWFRDGGCSCILGHLDYGLLLLYLVARLWFLGRLCKQVAFYHLVVVQYMECTKQMKKKKERKREKRERRKKRVFAFAGAQLDHGGLCYSVVRDSS